ncbi:glycoside hydrolase family 97 protein [candidate division KSB1 bacterium]|nr:glycoside hydrolase family 97 protein [candidate division KSB1 bacterium]
MHKCITLFFLLFIVNIHNTFASELHVASPDGTISAEVILQNGEVFYSISRLNRPLIENSRLGFVIKDQASLSKNWEIASSNEESVDEMWMQPWGEKKNIRNHYHELKINFKENTQRPRQMTIVFRVFNDGVGFRYVIPQQQQLHNFEIMDEITEFNLADNYNAWFIKAYQWNRYEYLYQKKPINEIDSVHTPITFETKNGLYLSIHEAALTDYSSMTLKRTSDHGFEADLVPWSDGVKVKTQTPLKTPWRTIQIADTPGGLITSYLILNLNEPNKLSDVSWIKPGKYVGIWWAMHLGKTTWSSGPKHGATTANAKRYIDFAAKYHLSGVLIEGWNIGWDGDWTANGDQFNFITSYPDFDIEEVSSYAAQRGVHIIGHHETGGAVMNYVKQMEDAVKFCNKYGVNTVKTGYVNWGTGIKRLDEHGNLQGEWHHGQYMVQHYRKVVETAAKYHIMICAHEPIKDTGIRRTYPNMMSREGARGQEYNAWSEDGGNPPDHTTILPFTRLLAGPMDFTPGIFDILLENDERPNNRIPTTLAKQLALYVVIYSPLQMAADLPENYEKNLKPFQFIVDVPVDWQDTKVLHSRIGDYVTIVRQDRNSDDWYLGSITDENGRMLVAPLNFLTEGKHYVAEIYRDGLSADYQTNPLDIDITEMLVDNGMTMMLRLAPGGGQAIRFRPANQNDVERLGGE